MPEQTIEGSDASCLKQKCSYISHSFICLFLVSLFCYCFSFSKRKRNTERIKSLRKKCRHYVQHSDTFKCVRSSVSCISHYICVQHLAHKSHSSLHFVLLSLVEFLLDQEIGLAAYKFIHLHACFVDWHTARHWRVTGQDTLTALPWLIKQFILQIPTYRRGNRTQKDNQCQNCHRTEIFRYRYIQN